MHQRINQARRLTWGGIGVAAALALTFAVLRIVNTEHLDTGEVLGAIALGAVALLPAAFAWRSLDRRPGLLLPAAFAAIAVGVVSFVFPPLGLLVAITWFVALRRQPGGDYRGWRAAVHGLVLVALAATALVVLFIHVDPECTETLADGTTRIVDPASRGFETGWAFSLPTTISGTSTTGPDVVVSFCTSDTIVVGEALASLALSAAAIALAWRWPPNPQREQAVPPAGGADPAVSGA